MVSDETSKRKRGPLTELTDAQLHNRRDQLVQLYEGIWSRIGPELQRCEQPDDLIRIFLPHLEGYGKDLLSVFCYPSDEDATGGALRKIRRELRTLVPPSYSVDELKRTAGQRLREANWAVNKAKNISRRIVRHQRKKAGKEVWEAEQQQRALVVQEKHLTQQRKKLEASFARKEIFRFIKSGRYDLNPQSLANASANLPFSGWRQSMKRTYNVPSVVREGQRYQVFKAIRFLANRARKNQVNAMIADFRAQIRSLPSRHGLARRELAKNWHFLSRAIRQCFKKAESPGILHFAITDLYFKNVAAATDVDRFVADHEGIQLPERRRRRPAKLR